MEGLNDEMSMQLMVATINNYQELVDKALMTEGKQQKIESRKRKYGQGNIIQEHRRSLVLPRTREDIPITMEAIPTMEEVCITTMVPRMGLGTEQATIRTAPIQPHPPRET